jgi:hypothetical protein
LAGAFHGQPDTDLLDEVSGKVRLYPVFSHGCDARLIAYDLTERLARGIHAEYLRGLAQSSTGPVQSTGSLPWQELSEDLRAANRAQVHDLAAKMFTVGCVVAPRRGLGGDVMSDEQVDKLAELEHDRWCAERRGQHWTYGPVRDDDKKLHPDLVEWENLRDDSRDKSRRAIRRLPDILGEAGFEIVDLGPGRRPTTHPTNSRPGRADVPVRVAVTGHTNLAPETAEMIYHEIVAYLDGLDTASLTGLTCLADGADQLFARAILAVGGRLEVILPTPDYRERVLRPDQWGIFDALLNQADEIHYGSYTEPGSDAYSAASSQLLQRSDFLVAIWDRKPGSNVGGTAHVVQQARDHGIPVTVMWPPNAQRTPALANSDQPGSLPDGCWPDQTMGQP